MITVVYRLKYRSYGMPYTAEKRWYCRTEAERVAEELCKLRHITCVEVAAETEK